MRRFFCAVAVAITAILSALLPTTSARADGSAGPVYYPNGDVATATKECDSGETCATISEASGEQIKVLIGASGHCNSYVMTFMRYRQEQLIAVWATPTDRNPDQPASIMGGMKCGGFRNTHMTIDSVVDMGIFQNTDGKVFVTFFGGSTTPPPATPSPPSPSSSTTP